MDYTYYALATAIFVFSILYWYLTNTYEYWRRIGVPCPDGIIPGLGHVYPLLFLRKNVGDMYLDIYNKIPNCSMIGIYNMRRPCVMVRDPELVKTVMSKNFSMFAENALKVDKDLDPLVHRNPFFLVDEQWKTTRQQLSAAFSSGKLKFMYSSVSEICEEFRRYLYKLLESNDGKVELELKDLFSRFTSGVVARAAFGVETRSFKSTDDDPFREAGREMFEPSLKKGMSQILTLFFPFLGKFFQLRLMPTKVDRFFREIVKDTMRYRAENGVTRPDFLQLMMHYKNIKTDEFNDDVITSHATSFFLDGYETSSIVLSFFCHHMAVHEDIQEKVRAEVKSVVGDHGGITYEAIQDMKYMDQALNESLRMVSAVTALFKICTEEIQLTGSDGITCKLTPGMEVIIPVWGLHRDPKYWPDPEKFDPERFSPENVQNRHKFVFLPFGDGPRICPGMRMAVMQIKAAVATILLDFRLEHSDRTKTPIQYDPNYFMTIAVGGLWANVKSL